MQSWTGQGRERSRAERARRNGVGAAYGCLVAVCALIVAFAAIAAVLAAIAHAAAPCRLRATVTGGQRPGQPITIRIGSTCDGKRPGWRTWTLGTL